MIDYSVSIPSHSVGRVPVPDIQQVHTDCHLALLLLCYNLINILIGVDIQGMSTERNLKCSDAITHTETCFSYYFCFTKNVTWPYDWQNCITQPSYIHPGHMTECSREQLLPEDVPSPSDWNVNSHQHSGKTTESHGILAVTNCWKFKQCLKLFLCMSLRHMEEQAYSSTHSSCWH
jgi:hypothetical protein